METGEFTEVGKCRKDPAEEKIMPSPKGRYYAVAHGRTTGIFTEWRYASFSLNQTQKRRLTRYSDAEAATEGFSGACHKRFNNELEAKAFIEDWKDGYANTWQRAIRQGLDDGWKPNDLKYDIGKILVKVDVKVGDEETLCSKLEQLDIKKEEF